MVSLELESWSEDKIKKLMLDKTEFKIGQGDYLEPSLETTFNAF